MNRTALWASLIGFVALVAVALGVNLARDAHPVLGLDLQGGLSVIYATAEPASEDELIAVRDLMRGQLEDFGIAEPDVRVEGENLIVDLPGVTDQAAAFEALQVSGIVTLRPVLQCQADTSGGTGDTSPDGTSPDVVSPDGTVDEESRGRAPIGFANPATADTTPDTTPATTPAELPDPPLPTDGASGEDLLAYPGLEQVCLVGPSGGTGEVFAQGSAGADINQQTGGWVVNVDLRNEGQAVWNGLAQQCFNAVASCPSRQLAIVLDDVIQSAPTVQTPDFPGTVQISGNFSEDEVRSLARVLNRGAFPVPVEQQRVETVSPTAGNDSLNAAIFAGLLGVTLTMIYMMFFYRRLAIVIVTGLAVWAGTVYLLATYVSQATNYAFTLAGATGVIVSIGITMDTYIVLFERLRDETRQGRLLRNAVPRSFATTWRTIVAANVVGLMSALILFWLSVGSVKGFALYVGITTICDLIVCWFFIRPAVTLFAQSRLAGDGRAATGVTAPIGASS